MLLNYGLFYLLEVEQKHEKSYTKSVDEAGVKKDKERDRRGG